MAADKLVKTPVLLPRPDSSDNYTVLVDYPGPFKCPSCKSILKRPLEFCAHCEEVHGLTDVKFACQICNRTGTIFSTSVHYDRCKTAQLKPKEGPPAEGAISCSAEGCGRAFTTFTGLRLHMKRAHPAMFEATKKPIVNQLWDKKEKILLAKLEIKLSGGTVLIGMNFQ
ncbi:hypothetical protein M514_20269 [Trichuris suis]|uniref:C2H2-type domain-containing protein n=1 Tax=Trichuris suis TaxID=68888 RepID=A0A085NDP6_9BILA|nr:hypothetical protein M514_20269 [Trichuris suis]